MFRRLIRKLEIWILDGDIQNLTASAQECARRSVGDTSGFWKQGESWYLGLREALIAERDRLANGL